MPDFRTPSQVSSSDGKPGEMADLLGRHLVDRDARVDVRAGGLLDPDAGQERAAGPRMVAGPVEAAVGIHLVQPAQDLDLLLDLLQRLQGPGELEVLPFLLGPPVTLMDAVGNVDESHPQRRARRRDRQRRPPLAAAATLPEQAGTRRRAGPAKRPRRGEMAAAQARHAAGRQQRRCADGLVSWLRSCLKTEFLSTRSIRPVAAETLRRFWNGADSITPISRAENRPPSRSSRSTIWSTVSTSL